ncbi:cornichon protein-domain-containing protein [Mycena vulgaris]|nr:cornichon protein-domain-containing protein [Mycena vulgaris]
MSGTTWLFIFAVVMAAGLMFTALFLLILLGDLESGNISRSDFCDQLTQIVPLENIAHAFLATLFLLSRQWTAFLLNAPLLAYNANKIRNKTHIYVAFNYNTIRNKNRIRNKNHIYEASGIFQTLPDHKKQSFIKLGFYLLSFFFYLYRLIVALVEET